MHQRLSPGHKKGDDARNDDPKNTDDDGHPIAGDLSFKQILQVVTVGITSIGYHGCLYHGRSSDML